MTDDRNNQNTKKTSVAWEKVLEQDQLAEGRVTTVTCRTRRFA